MFKYLQIEQLLLEGKSASEIAEIVPSTINYVNYVKSKLGIVNAPEQMVEHHTHYEEIHGYDKTVWMTRSKHSKLHQRLRKNGECNVPVDEMKRIASAASHRTDKYKENMRKSKYRRDYQLKNIWKKQYRTPMMPNIALTEYIKYNMVTNHLSVSSGFYGTSKQKPLVIDII